MKTKILLSVFMLVSAASLFSQVADSTFIKKWNFGHFSWNGIRPADYSTTTQATIDATASLASTALADTVIGFDVQSADFDATWASIKGDGYPIAKNNGLAASDHGAADFSGAFKVLYDDYNMYILVKWTDDDILGTESLEFMWAQDLLIDGSKNIYINGSNGSRPWFQYGRYAPFGAYKASFASTGFSSVMYVNSKADPAVAGNIIGDIQWSYTSGLMSGNLYQDDKTAPGSNTIKRIITIGYPALTGEQRPEFNPAIWKTRNNQKGIIFDVKVSDPDTDDAYNTAATPVKKPAEYWWNSNSNSGYSMNYYSGYLKINDIPNGVNGTIAERKSIFSKQGSDMIILSKKAKLSVYDSVGKLVLINNNATDLNLKNFKKGIYFIEADHQVLKIVK